MEGVNQKKRSDSMLVCRWRGLVYYKLPSEKSDFQKGDGLCPACAFFMRGVTYLEEGWMEEAVESFDQAIEVDPKFLEAYNNRGVALAFQGKKEQAKADFKKAGLLAHKSMSLVQSKVADSTKTKKEKHK